MRKRSFNKIPNNLLRYCKHEFRCMSCQRNICFFEWSYVNAKNTFQKTNSLFTKLKECFAGAR